MLCKRGPYTYGKIKKTNKKRPDISAKVKRLNRTKGRLSTLSSEGGPVRQTVNIMLGVLEVGSEFANASIFGC